MNIKISVRELVEFILRSGDIDSTYRGKNRMSDGTKIHSKIQKSMDENYSSEVTLKTEVEFSDLKLTVAGRADGIIKEEENIIIDEIKSTTKNLEKIDENFNDLHWAQAKCYGYIYAKDNELSSIDIQLTYVELDTEEIKKIRKSYRFNELEIFFKDLTDRYYIWAKLSRDWIEKRDESIKALEFPFDRYRKGQRRLAVGVYRTIEEEKKLFVEASTGIGKTISTLFPAIKAIGEKRIEKIFYLTAKTITRTVAEDSFDILEKNGLKFKRITLTAKDKICFEKDKTCNPDECKFAKGHFDRVNDAIYELITKEDNVSRETIEKYAKIHEVCPFEFSLDLSIWADGIICDYNYVFDPQAKLKRFFFEEKNKYIYLIDEAHNLVDRAREMFSAELFKRDILDMKRVFKDIEPKISKILDRINREFLKLKKLCKDKDYHIRKEEVEDIYYPLKKFIKLADNWLIENGDKKEHADLLNLYFKIVSFLRVSEDYSEKFVTYIERKDKDILVKLFCLDPSYLLSNTLNSGLSAILFSATLSPMEYFKDILGGREDDNMMKLESPFDRENLKVVIEDKISTKYRNRKYSYEKLADKIYQVSKYRKGNYMAFFPSYKYMQDVYEVFIERYSNIATMIQVGGMKEEEREEFLNKFIDEPKETLVSFVVMGGIFSEGIDLKGERLTGAIIVGVGLPKICLERNIIRDYFDDKNGLGYEYAYMYPGMNKVLQAAGRVIRTETDKGIVVLIDERFAYKSYKDIFPPHLR